MQLELSVATEENASLKEQVATITAQLCDKQLTLERIHAEYSAEVDLLQQRLSQQRTECFDLQRSNSELLKLMDGRDAASLSNRERELRLSADATDLREQLTAVRAALHTKDDTVRDAAERIRGATHVLAQFRRAQSTLAQNYSHARSQLLSERERATVLRTRHMRLLRAVRRHIGELIAAPFPASDTDRSDGARLASDLREMLLREETETERDATQAASAAAADRFTSVPADAPVSPGRITPLVFGDAVMALSRYTGQLNGELTEIQTQWARLHSELALLDPDTSADTQQQQQQHQQQQPPQQSLGYNQPPWSPGRSAPASAPGSAPASPRTRPQPAGLAPPLHIGELRSRMDPATEGRVGALSEPYEM
jgi:hypothetical protein